MDASPTDNRPLALWAIPRSVSTAFEKMMRTRGDHQVFGEPFAACYYFGPQRPSRRYDASPDLHQRHASYADTLDKIVTAHRQRPVFIKDIALHLGPFLTQSTLEQFHGSFLLRDPAYSLPSLAKLFPDFTDGEAGFAPLHTAWTILRSLGENPAVIDGNDIKRNPNRVIELWCQAVGIPTRSDALRWQPGMAQEWETWSEWFTKVGNSTGLEKCEVGEPPLVDERMAKRIDSVRPLYREMEVHKLVVG